jgi:hypothetical protein
MKKLVLPCIALLFLLPGCFKRKLTLRTKAQADSKELPVGFSRGTSFAIGSPRLTDEEKQQSELLTKEIERKLSHALISNGYQIKPLAQADYALSFSYGAERSEYTVQTLKSLPDRVVVTNGRTSAVISGGYTYVPETCVNYSKYLTVTAYYAPEMQQHHAGANSMPHSIWHATISCDDGYENLRTDIDFLIVEMMRYFGSDLQDPRVATLKADNNVVEEFRSSYHNPGISMTFHNVDLK